MAEFGGLTRAAAEELGRFNIRVNGVRPGWMRTEAMADSLSEANRTIIRKGWDNGLPVCKRGRGKTLVEVFGQSNLPQVVRKMIAAVNDSEGDEARILRYHIDRYGLAA